MSKDFECDPVLESSVPCKIRRKLKCSMVPSIFPHNAHDEELQAELLKRRRIEVSTLHPLSLVTSRSVISLHLTSLFASFSSWAALWWLRLKDPPSTSATNDSSPAELPEGAENFGVSFSEEPSVVSEPEDGKGVDISGIWLFQHLAFVYRHGLSLITTLYDKLKRLLVMLSKLIVFPQRDIYPNKLTNHCLTYKKYRNVRVEDLIISKCVTWKAWFDPVIVISFGGAPMGHFTSTFRTKLVSVLHFFFTEVTHSIHGTYT